MYDSRTPAVTSAAEPIPTTRTSPGYPLQVVDHRDHQDRLCPLCHRTSKTSPPDTTNYASSASPRNGIHLDHGLTGTNRNRPRLDQARAAARQHDTMVVTKLGLFARSVPDARAIGDEIAGGVKLSLGGQVHDPTDPVGKMFCSMPAIFAESASDLLRIRTRKVMPVAKAKGKPKSRGPKLSDRQQAELPMHRSGAYAINDLAEALTIGRPTVYKTLHRDQCK